MCVTELNIRISNICRNWCIINLLFFTEDTETSKGVSVTFSRPLSRTC